MEKEDVIKTGCRKRILLLMAHPAYGQFERSEKSAVAA
jgi:hypothetical protein